MCGEVDEDVSGDSKMTTIIIRTPNTDAIEFRHDVALEGDHSNNAHIADLPAREIALEYAKSKLDEAYKREESIKDSASMQIAIFSFLISGIITLEIGLFSNGFRLYILSLIFSIITIFTMLVAILFAILSQWRMVRAHFPDAKEVIRLINNSDDREKLHLGIKQLTCCYAEAADSMDKNNRKRTSRIMTAHILAVVSIGEMLFFLS